MLEFLKLMKESALTGLRKAPVEKPDAELRAFVTEHKAQYNLMYMLVELPTMIKEYKDQMEAATLRTGLKAAAMHKSQEGGSL